MVVSRAGEGDGVGDYHTLARSTAHVMGEGAFAVTEGGETRCVDAVVKDFEGVRMRVVRNELKAHWFNDA